MIPYAQSAFPNAAPGVFLHIEPAMLIVMLAAGCSKKSSYEKACQHMIDLTKAELEKQIEKIKVEDMKPSSSALVARTSSLSPASFAFTT